MAPKKVSVTVKYSKPGTQPPVFLAGSFSEPPWQPQEMRYTIDRADEHVYQKDIEVEEGEEYQYKFRIGLGDWWVLNEDSPTVTDDAGNRNNLLTTPLVERAPEDVDDAEATLDTPDTEISHELISTPAAEMAKRSKRSVKKTPKPSTAIVESGPSEEDEVSSPLLVVEKTGTEPRHGDDFGEKATVAQKDAFERRAQDAEPDHIVAQRVDTPDVAAEVADTAAILDQELPTPPVSDEEAGRTGYRRMSQTPIPEVAKTAAEVADVAATLDKESLPIEPFPSALLDLEDHGSACDSCKSTPPNEKVPKFSHESIGLRPPEKEGPPTHEHIDPMPKPRIPGYEEADDAIDLSNPNIEVFPTTREEIIARLRRLSEHLPEDVTNVDITPASPVIDPNHLEGFEQLAEEPSAPLEEHSPPLHIIAEEDDEPENPSSFLPVTSSTVLNVDIPSTWSVVKDEKSTLRRTEPISKNSESLIETATSAEETIPSEAVDQSHEIELAPSKIDVNDASNSNVLEVGELEPASCKAEVNDQSNSNDELEARELEPVAFNQTIEAISIDKTAEESASEEEPTVDRAAELIPKLEESADDESTSEDESSVDEARPMTSGTAKTELEESSSDEESLVEEEKQKPVVPIEPEVEESSSEEEPVETVVKPAATRTAIEESSSDEEEIPVIAAKSETESSPEEQSSIEEASLNATTKSEVEDQSSSEDGSDSAEIGSVATSAQPELAFEKAEAGDKSVLVEEPEHTKETPATAESHSTPTSIVAEIAPETAIEEPASTILEAELAEGSAPSSSKEHEDVALESATRTEPIINHKAEDAAIVPEEALLAVIAPVLVASELHPAQSAAFAQPFEIGEKQTTPIEKSEPVEEKSRDTAEEESILVEELASFKAEPILLDSETQPKDIVVAEKVKDVVEFTSTIPEPAPTHESVSEVKELDLVQTSATDVDSESPLEASLLKTLNLAIEDHVPADSEPHFTQESIPLIKEADLVTTDETTSIPAADLELEDSAVGNIPEIATENHAETISKITPTEQSDSEPREQEPAETRVPALELKLTQEAIIDESLAVITEEEHSAVDSEVLIKETLPTLTEAEPIAEPSLIPEAETAKSVELPKAPEFPFEEHAGISAEGERSTQEDSIIPDVDIHSPNTETPTLEAAKSPEWRALQPKPSQPSTPFIMSNQPEGIRRISTGQDSPTITVQPATPGGSTSNIDPLNIEPLDAAKSTATEEAPTQVKSRKLQKVPSPERPLTPSSIRSSGKDARDKNFLKAFWRVVFIDWIGGLILKLRGGGRGRNALLAVGTIAVFAIAPALYFLR